MFKKLLGVLVLVFMIGVLGACEESEISKVKKEDDSNNSSEVSSDVVKNKSNEVEGETITNETFSIGDTVSINGVEVTVNGAREVQDDWFEPSNDKYIAIDVLVENKTDEPYHLSSLMQLNLFDELSYSQDMALVNTKGSLDGEIGVGRKMAGEIAFDVTESSFYEFVFEDPFMTGQAIWVINADEIQ